MRMRERSQGKNEKRTEIKKKEYYWRVMDTRVKKQYIWERRREHKKHKYRYRK